MAKTKEATVDTPCGGYNAMATGWALINDLLAGSAAMRANATTYLPQFRKEKEDHYKSRVANSILFSAYGDTVKSITSKPFSRPVTIQGELPEPLDQIEADTDGQSKSLAHLAKDTFTEFVNRGIGHILVDFPVTATQEGKTPNLGEERQAGYRPRLVPIAPDQLIGWRVETDASGKPVLNQIRIRETKTEADGEWGEKQVEYIRVIGRNDWQLYQKGEKDEYVLSVQGMNSLGEVPLVTGYANPTGFLTADPPLKELAETNLAHFRSDSDQRNILHMARTATLFAKGFTTEEGANITLGPNQIITSENPNADVRFVEHTGAAINAGKEDIEKLEERMVMLGLQPFLRNVANQTATGQGIDESRANCDIQAWVMALEDLLYRAYQMAAEWVKVELPEDFKIDVFNDFALWGRVAQDAQTLLQMRQAKELSRRTFLREVKRRAILSETVDVDEEIQEIEAEGPSLGMIGLEGETETDDTGEEE